MLKVLDTKIQRGRIFTRTDTVASFYLLFLNIIECKLPYSLANLKEKIIKLKLRKMKKTLFTENQIIAMLKQHEQGIKVQDIARTNGKSEKTIYRWKSKYGGMDAKELKRVKELEHENFKLKKMYAELALLNNALQDLIEKKF